MRCAASVGTQRDETVKNQTVLFGVPGGAACGQIGEQDFLMDDLGFDHLLDPILNTPFLEMLEKGAEKIVTSELTPESHTAGQANDVQIVAKPELRLAGDIVVNVLIAMHRGEAAVLA